MPAFSVYDKASRPSRYIVAGVANSAFGLSLFWILSGLGINYVLVISVTTFLGAVFNYMTVSIAFASRLNVTRLVRFFLVYFATFLLNIAGIFTLTAMGFSTQLSGLLFWPVMVVTSYIIHSHYTFGNSDFRSLLRS